MASKGILYLGTVRSNRVPHCITTTDAELKKKGRGHSWRKSLLLMGLMSPQFAGLITKPFIFYLHSLVQSQLKTSHDWMPSSKFIAKLLALAMSKSITSIWAGWT